MIFSVFNPAERCFDYYEAPGNSSNYGARGTKYRALHGAPQGPGPRDGIGCVGFAPESLALPLPNNARRVGTGTVARGIVAVRGEARGGGLGSWRGWPAGRAPAPQAPARSGVMRAMGLGDYTTVGGPPQLLDPELGAYGALVGLGDGELNGVSLGDVAEAVTVAPVDVVAPRLSLGQVVGAACVASIVGVLVQRALK